MSKNERLAFAEDRDPVRLLIPHPHDYREWRVIGANSVPGFYHLESTINLGRLDDHDIPNITRFELVLHESQFERI